MPWAHIRRTCHFHSRHARRSDNPLRPPASTCRPDLYSCRPVRCTTGVRGSLFYRRRRIRRAAGRRRRRPKRCFEEKLCGCSPCAFELMDECNEFYGIPVFCNLNPHPMTTSMIRNLLLPALIATAFCLPAHGQSDSMGMPCMEKAERLLDEALTFMEKNYYRKDEISWPEFRDRARQELRTAGNCEDAYASISWCFRQPNEPHSFVMAPDKAALYNGEAASSTALSALVGQIRGEWLQDSIGYLTVPWVSTDDSLLCERIADSLQHVIAHLDARGGISRWIIDLRKNTGGNCWPMLTGIGPLLGNGVCGYFVSGDQRVPITYHEGSAFQGRHIRCRVSHEGYRTQKDRKYIVILTGPRTVSAGETVALAFRGKALTYFIGQPTAGLTTANATYPLSDNSMLVLTICQEADCTGRICEGRIRLDMLVSPVSGDSPGHGAPATPANDPVKEAAIGWLTTTNFTGPGGVRIMP